MSSGDNSCARTRGWNWDYQNSSRLESKSSSSEEDMSFHFEDSDRSDQSSDDGYGSEPVEKESADLGKDLTGLNVSAAHAREGYFLDREDEQLHFENLSHGRYMSTEEYKDRNGKYKDEYRKREKDHDKWSMQKERSHDKSSRESKRRKEDADDKKPHERQKRSEKSQKWEREDDSEFYKRDKHRERDDDRKDRHRGDEYSDHDSYRRDKHWDSSRSSHHKGFGKVERDKDAKRARLDGEQRISNRARSPSRSPRANKGARSPSPQHKDDEKDPSNRDREGSSRHRRSGLGGYSPRRRRSDAAIRTPSPPARSPERKKTRAWDLPPVGMDSGVAAAVAAAHQAAAQQAAALASVSSLVTVNPALAAVSLTQATRNFRRLYIGNVPASVSEAELLDFINAAMVSVNANHLPGTKPCINCMVNVEKSYAFAEFLTPEDATAGLVFDGITLHGTTLKIRRPRDYIAPPNGGVGIGSVLGMVSSAVPDSPQKIFVGGICKTLNAEKVKEIVTAFGQLKAYRWEIMLKNNQFEGFAFLEYLDPLVTLKACAGLNGMKLGNRVLTVVQATPSANSEGDGKQEPFYGVPEHAKRLLEAPTRILELQNVVTRAEVYSMSEEELLEIEEDIRTECKRFGTVKSTHMVKLESKLDETSDDKVEKTNATGQLLLLPGDAQTAEVDKRIAEYIASVGGQNGQNFHPVEDTEADKESTQEYIFWSMNASDGSAQEVPGTELVEGGPSPVGPSADLFHVSEKPSENGSGSSDGQILIEESQMDRSDVQGRMDVEEKTMDTEDQATIPDNAEAESNTVVEGITTIETSQPVNENIEPNETSSQPHELVLVGQIFPSDMDVAEAAADAVESLNAQINESDLGRVYVEFTREEVCCIAAHALHGRLYANRPVMAGYFPLKMYQKKFKKGLEPRTHEERQILALAAQEHLNSFIPDFPN